MLCGERQCEGKRNRKDKVKLTRYTSIEVETRKRWKKGKWEIKNDSRKAETIQENCYACNKTSNLFEEVILLVTKCRGSVHYFMFLPSGPPPPSSKGI